MDTVEMRALAAWGCVVCASSNVVASISIEHGGVLGHYPACVDHVEQVVARVMADLQPRPPGTPVVHYTVRPEIDGPTKETP